MGLLALRDGWPALRRMPAVDRWALTVLAGHILPMSRGAEMLAAEEGEEPLDGVKGKQARHTTFDFTPAEEHMMEVVMQV